jgi:hypothetical protein
MNKKRDPISTRKKYYIFFYIIIYQSFFLIIAIFIVLFCVTQPNFGIGTTNFKYFNPDSGPRGKLVLGDDPTYQ